MLKIYKKLKRYEIISFDIFDTLLYRKVNKIEELFKKVEKKLQNKNIFIENYVMKRQEAEKKVKEKYGYYYTFNDIYDEIKCEEKIKKKIMLLELEEEYINCFPNYTMKLMYEKLKKLNKKIIFTSDMYLPREQIEKMLLKCGYEKEEIFLSCDIRKSKRDRSIYPYILEKLKISSKKIIHLGDAKRSDYLNARLCGIKSILISPKKHEETKLYEYIVEKLRNDDKFYMYGLKIFAPVFLGFCEWLYEEIKKDEIEKLFFFTREGKFFKEIYDLLYSEEKTRLLYISRKSISSANIKSILSELTRDNVDRIFSFTLTETIDGFFKRINLDFSKYEEKALKYNLKKETIIRKNKESCVNFILELKPLLILETQKYEERLIKYLENEEFSGEVGIIDIGWAGSIQYNLDKFCSKNNIEADIKGYYLGIDNTFDMFKKGYLYSPKHLELKNKVLSFSGLLEIITMPNIGSTLFYKVLEDKVVPVLDKNEFGNDYIKIEKLQQGVRDFINFYKVEKEKYELKYYFKTKIETLLKLGLTPSKKEILDFANLTFYDNGIEKQIVMLDNFSKIITSIPKLKQNFLDSKWKNAYLINLFRLRLNYSDIIGFFRKFK